MSSFRTLRKTVEHYARSERDHASGQTIQELTDAAAALQSMEAWPEAWMIAYADVDRPAEYYCGEGAESAAIRRFEMLKMSWTCRLFRCIAETGYGPTVGAPQK